jgi:hypothetical protein
VSSPVVSASCSSCSLTGSHFQHHLRGRASPDSDLVRTDGVGLFARRRNRRWRARIAYPSRRQVIAARAGSQMHVMALTGHERTGLSWRLGKANRKKAALNRVGFPTKARRVPVRLRAAGRAKQKHKWRPIDEAPQSLALDRFLVDNIERSIEGAGGLSTARRPR